MKKLSINQRPSHKEREMRIGFDKEVREHFQATGELHSDVYKMEHQGFVDELLDSFLPGIDDELLSALRQARDYLPPESVNT